MFIIIYYESLKRELKTKNYIVVYYESLKRELNMDFGQHVPLLKKDVNRLICSFFIFYAHSCMRIPVVWRQQESLAFVPSSILAQIHVHAGISQRRTKKTPLRSCFLASCLAICALAPLLGDLTFASNIQTRSKLFSWTHASMTASPISTLLLRETLPTGNSTFCL